MKFNLHATEYPFPVVNGVTIEAEDDEHALAIALEWHRSEENPHPVVSRQDHGHVGNH